MPLTIDPAINMWDQSQWDAVNSGFQSVPSALSGIKVSGVSSPWTLPMPDPFSLGPGLVGESWESGLLGEPSEPRYVQLGQLAQFDQPMPQAARGSGVPSLERAVFGAERYGSERVRQSAPMAASSRPRPIPIGPMGPMAQMAPIGPSSVTSESLALAGRSKLSPALRDDPGLSGQRLKRVLHVKQAPIYKYAEWCSHWIQKGGRTSEDPMTPRSDLTKSEFDIQYGAWRKALVEGPPTA